LNHEALQNVRRVRPPNHGGLLKGECQPEIATRPEVGGALPGSQAEIQLLVQQI
jgi:hypothetical protein